MYKILYTHSYNKRASRFIKDNGDLEKQYLKTLQLLEVNPFHPSLRIHKLSGKLVGLHAVSINIQYRILLQFIIREKSIIPVMVGKHEDVYR